MKGNNLTFLRSVYRNPLFRKGLYSTSFIADQYRDGFHGVKLSSEELQDVLAITAAIHEVRFPAKLSVPRSAAAFNLFEGCADANDDLLESRKQDLVISVGTDNFQVALSLTQQLEVSIQPIGGVEVASEHANKILVNLADFEWLNGQPLGRVTFTDGRQEYVQFLGCDGSNRYTIRYRGAEQQFTVWSPEEFLLSKYMLPVVAKDLSRFLVSPMPGTLISVGVVDGQVVEEGQQLAVVEAMKMQNVLRAEKKGQVKKIHKLAGQHLKVDEVIVEFV